MVSYWNTAYQALARLRRPNVIFEDQHFMSLIKRNREAPEDYVSKRYCSTHSRQKVDAAIKQEHPILGIRRNRVGFRRIAKIGDSSEITFRSARSMSLFGFRSRATISAILADYGFSWSNYRRDI